MGKGAGDDQKISAKGDIARFFAFLFFPMALLAVTLVTTPLTDRLYCPRGNLACWSTGQTAFFLPLAALVFTFGALIMRWPLPRIARSKRFVPAAIVVVTGLTMWLRWMDIQKFVAITHDGMLLKNDISAEPILYRWNDVRNVIARCETGSRSGPKLRVYFHMRNGDEVGVNYKTWISATVRDASLAENTAPLPYSTLDLNFCRRFYSYLPLKDLNSHPRWFAD